MAGDAMTMPELLTWLNSGGIVALLLFNIQLGLTGKVIPSSVVRSIVREVVHVLIDEGVIKKAE